LQAGLGAVQLGLGGHLAAGEFGHLAQAAERGARLGDGRLGLVHLGLGGGQVGFRFHHRVLQLGDVQACQDLALFHPVVHVDLDPLDDARQLAADLDLVGRRQGAAGRDGDGEVAALRRLGLVVGHAGVVRGFQPEVGDGGEGEQYQGDQDVAQAPPARGGGPEGELGADVRGG